MSSVLPEPTISEEQLFSKRLAELHKSTTHENEFRRRLAQQKLRELGNTTDVSGLLKPRS